jgi:hypothetical protein
VLAERSDKRTPLASLTMEADTPALLALILSRSDCKVSVAPTYTLTDAVSGLSVKLVWSAFQLPSWNVSVPLPTSDVAAGNVVPDARVWLLASACTVTA